VDGDLARKARTHLLYTALELTFVAIYYVTGARPQPRALGVLGILTR